MSWLKHPLRALLLLALIVSSWLLVARSEAKPGRLGASALAVQANRSDVRLVSATPSPFVRSALVAQMIAGVQQSELYSYTGSLSGEFPITLEGQSIALRTRNAYNTTLTRQATQYAYGFLQAHNLAVSYLPWYDAANDLSGRNVVGVLTGTVHPDEIVLLSAHLDDMPEGYRAPGADDDASGSAGVMETAARLAGNRFERTVRFVFFTGEEYGPSGSAAYAAECLAKHERIVALFNLDMIGWDGNDDGRITLHTRYTNDTAGYERDMAIVQVFRQVLSAYEISNLQADVAPDRESDVDNISFWDAGYPGILMIEDFGLEENPNYHTPGDTLQTLNLPFFTRNVRAAVGTVAHLAMPVESVPNQRVFLPLTLRLPLSP